MSRRVVALGGGTGLPAVLRALRKLGDRVPLEATAIVNVADDGGSSGRLRESLGILPPGDIRNCLAACSKDGPLRSLFNYRFHSSGELDNHSLGNLMLAALAEMEGDFTQAISAASDLLGVDADVLPAATVPLVVTARLQEGRLVVGQSRVAQTEELIVKLALEPSDPPVLPVTLEAIRHADYILVGPGSLYSSILPVLLVPAIKRAIASSPALTVYLCNTMSFRAETLGYSAREHLTALLNHTAPDFVDLALAHDPGSFSEGALAVAAQEGARPVPLDDADGDRWLVRDLADAARPMRHCPTRLAAVLEEVFGDVL